LMSLDIENVSLFEIIGVVTERNCILAILLHLHYPNTIAWTDPVSNEGFHPGL
jgi:hypothetical protein